MQDILAINAHLKYVEYLLYLYDNESEEITLRQIKEKFRDKFGVDQILLNQNFGIYRLLPLILMKEEYKKQKRPLLGDVAEIKIIRDAISHHNFTVDEKGYQFSDGKKTEEFSYEEFVAFIHRIENSFYSENSDTIETGD